MSGVLQGRSAIVTGASRGLGLEIAKRFVGAGAHVLICARNAAELENAAEELRRACPSGQTVLAEAADVSNAADAEGLVRSALRAFGGLEVLVNNAGVYGPKGAIEDVDFEEWKRAVEINLFGSVLMCRAAIPHFRERRYGKIVQLSGGGATHPLPFISAYAASKAAAVRMTENLADELRDAQVDVNAIAPGALNTRMLDEVLAAGPEKVGAAFYERAVKQKEEGGTPVSRGADLAVFLASAASDGISGRLLSAVWDPWESLPDRAGELGKTDIYTLRRIVPKDRGLDWDR
jgi:NAD(P)-dependent dehydrogenase (short-subunit alcohol dehydrogenase family)